MNSDFELDASLLKELIISGYKNLNANRQIVDELNVFPVPDGDTGSNMVKTMEGGFLALDNKTFSSVGEVAKSCSDGMLLYARGNSGVILSQLFYGFARTVENEQKLTFDLLVKSLECGVKQGYMSVDTPTEGTMLTVARETAEFIKNMPYGKHSLQNVVIDSLKACNDSVQNTPELLPILKESGVVDSGGAGLYYILEGFKKYLSAEQIGENTLSATESEVDYSKFDENSSLSYPYCSEVLLQLLHSKTDIEHFDLSKMREFLNSIGDSLVLVQTGSRIKIHVHTYTPHKLLEYCQKHGEFLKIKIENMTLQHSDANIQNNFAPRVVQEKNKKKFALVSVASGDGIIQMFKDFGADVVIDGGQTNNPSVEDFIKSFDQAYAENIFVLPNNSNIYATACQAAQMYKLSNIVVIDSKNIGDGYSILSMLDYSSDDSQQIAENMKNDMSQTITGMVTKAVRDATCNSIDILRDDYIALCGKKVIISSGERIRTICGMLDTIMSSTPRDFATAIYGKTITQSEKTFFKNYVSSKYPTLELYEIDGMQEIYDFYIVLS